MYVCDHINKVFQIYAQDVFEVEKSCFFISFNRLHVYRMFSTCMNLFLLSSQCFLILVRCLFQLDVVQLSGKMCVVLVFWKLRNLTYAPRWVDTFISLRTLFRWFRILWLIKFWLYIISYCEFQNILVILQICLYKKNANLTPSMTRESTNALFLVSHYLRLRVATQLDQSSFDCRRVYVFFEGYIIFTQLKFNLKTPIIFY